MIGIPPAVDTDVEDVVWALETATSLWKRNERVDAIVWLRRAAQAAGEAEHDERALLLARGAAELTDWIAKNPGVSVSFDGSVSSIPPNDSSTGGVDDLLRASIADIVVEETPHVSMSAMTEPHAFMPMPNVPVVHPVPVAPTTGDLIPVAEASSVAVFQSVADDRSSENVQTAAEAHAGMLDPWSTPQEEAPAPPEVVSPVSAVVSSDQYEDEVVTSARPVIPPAEPAVVMPAPVAQAKLPPPRPPPRKPSTPLPPPLEAAPEAAPESLSPDFVESVPSSALPAAMHEPPLIRFPNEQTLVSAGNVAHENVPEPPPTPIPTPRAGRIDLSAVDALTDLPDDARAELERVAHVHTLACDEEIMGFALAYVVEGDIDVAAQIVDAPAERISTGAVLKAKGTHAESTPLRLICASENAIVATWDAAQIEPAFKTCPWVEDDLRALANRMQALVGVTLGPLADRLDATLRAQVTDKLTLRELAEGEIIVEAGHAVRELCLIGQGSIELVKDGAVVGEVSVGEFLFPAEIMGGGKAPSTARGGKGGALLLASDRAVAQELMSTCPPLLEIFSGM